MVRLVFIFFTSLPQVVGLYLKSWFILTFRKVLTEKFCYSCARKAVLKIMKHGFIRTEVYGRENLPASGGYVMFSNHQGKYDAVGIMYGHESPCTILMDKRRSYLPLMNEFLTIIKGMRLDRSSIKKQIKGINKVAEEVKAGRRYIVFPEGGYKNNHNTVQEFKAGAFKCAIKAKCPVVPVALIDAWKPFGINSLKPVTTKVIYLKPILYEEYKNMSSVELADKVKAMIVEEIARRTGGAAE